VIGDASIADMPSFDHFVGERGNERFDACLPLRFVASLSLGVITSANVANVIQGDLLMQLSSAIRAALIALTVTGAGLTTVYADFGSIRFNVIKAGFVVGGSGGSGTLVFHGRPYPISIGGVSYGFTFGASATDFVGEVSNIRTPFDVNGVYGAAGAGIAVGPGAGGIVLVNQNGAVLTLSGRQMGLIVAADLNGLVISLR
jgi:hypothetical protein